jgi:hypothetical protein
MYVERGGRGSGKKKRALLSSFVFEVDTHK